MLLADYLNSLPQYSVTVITLPNGSKAVKFTSTIHTRKEYICPTTWSSEYTDGEVYRSDITEKWLISITGYRKVTKWDLNV